MRAGLILAVSVVSAGLGGLAAGGEEAEMVDLSWVENIRASFPIPASKEDVDSCIVGDESPCDLSSFTKDRSTVVYPGGDTRCIFSSSTPFGFQVIRGDSDKLLFDFQGGGACWDGKFRSVIK
jgi:hypothetical protein